MLTKATAEKLAGQIPEGWQFHPVRSSGFFVVKGCEVHCWRLEEKRGRWITRQDIERITRPLIAQYGGVTTSVRLENDEGHAFVQRLGFRMTGSDDRAVYYRAERLNHARH